MPTLKKSQTRDGPKKSEKAKVSNKKKNRKEKEAQSAPVEKTILNDEDTPISPFGPDSADLGDGEEGADNVGHVELVMPVPFSDGLVSVAFRDSSVIPKRGGEEVDLLRGFLGYYATYGTYIGNIASKVSFMKKQGGRLL